MSSRNKSDVKKLFEYWCEVSKNFAVNNDSVDRYPDVPGVIIENFPEYFRDKKAITEIPAFAFPCEFIGDSVQSYSFVLTTDDSKWRFGFCRHDPKTMRTMVIITLLPWHDTFLKFLTVLAEVRRVSQENLRQFLSEAYNSAIPDFGCQLKLMYNDGRNEFIFERPKQFQLPSIPENHNLNLYYNFVDPKNMIAVFAAMLAERRIIFTSKRLDRLSSCIQAANAFLYPMVWQHIFIPVLPMKFKDYLMAPMPYLIGVPQIVLETMIPEELGEVVILNCDTKVFESPFNDVQSLPPNIVSQLKKQLNQPQQHMGDCVSKIFLSVLVQLIGGYRDAIEFRSTGKTFNSDKFIESRPPHLRAFLAKMMQLQIFQQFIDERLEMMNTGLGFSDEFEQETVRYAEKLKKRSRFYQLKEKTNPAVKSAVKSVKESSRFAKHAYKDLKSKFREITPANTQNSYFRSHIHSNMPHDCASRNDYYDNKASVEERIHHSAPNSPIFSKHYNHHVRTNGDYSSYTGATIEIDMGSDISSSPHLLREPTSLSMATAISRKHTSEGRLQGYYGNYKVTISPSDSLCSSEMNLSQELQNHPLFKIPIEDQHNQHFLVEKHSEKTYNLPCTTEEEYSNKDLITLEDVNNTLSLEIADFDPLNQSSRCAASSFKSNTQISSDEKNSTNKSNFDLKTIITANGKSCTNHPMCNASISNPMNNYYTSHNIMQRHKFLEEKPPPLPKSIPPPMPSVSSENDNELLRKYGLDQFSVNTGTASMQPKALGCGVICGQNYSNKHPLCTYLNVTTKCGIGLVITTANIAAITSTTTMSTPTRTATENAITSGMKNWTTFD